ncbi:MAG: hypothetical protein M3O46_23355 [Myxococcota bacterium]|nr:hypothetical protein [Myxococcota bacterium]
MNKAVFPCLLTAAVLAGGCVVEATGATSAGVIVSAPPPELMRETPSAPSRPRVIWIPGYWHWTGMQYTWIPGHWEDGPAGLHWRAPRYLLRDGVYYYEPGGWSGPPR